MIAAHELCTRTDGSLARTAGRTKHQALRSNLATTPTCMEEPASAKACSGVRRFDRCPASASTVFPRKIPMSTPVIGTSSHPRMFSTAIASALPRAH